MCGIVFDFDKKNNSDLSVIDEMIDAIEHRGKDQRLVQRHYLKNNGSISVGFRRLAIVNTTSPQPGISRDWVVYLNGEIYNYKELNIGGVFGECNTIARHLDVHGIAGVMDFNGMFFILAINKKTGEVFVARDRYGIKPAYFFKTQNGYVFASEIKALIKHPKYRVSQNQSAIEQWLSFNNIFSNNGNDTLFKGVYRFDKGSYMCLNTGTEIKYWSWDFKPTYSGTYNEAVLKVRELVTQAINRQIPSDLKYGTCLSSGIDSNIINALMPSYTSLNAYSFTASFVGENLDVTNEMEIASKYGKNHNAIEFTEVCFFTEAIKASEDLRLGANWSSYGLFWLASKLVKVLFDGAGADELFGGYSWRYDLSKDYYSVVNRTGYYNELSTLQYKLAAIQNDGVSDVYKRYKFDAIHFLEGLLNINDKLSMAHTIELRVPFLDNDLVDFAVTLPSEWKENKKILKDAFADLLPTEVLNGKKQGFSSPDWFSGKGNKANKWANAALNEWKNIYFKP